MAQQHDGRQAVDRGSAQAQRCRHSCATYRIIPYLPGLIVWLWVTVSACATPPLSDRSPSAPSVTPTLKAGSYVLRLSPDERPGGACLSIAGDAGSPPATVTVSLALRVDGDHLVGHDPRSSLTLLLSQEGTTVSGGLRGVSSADSSGLTVAAGDVTGDAVVQGTVHRSDTAGGDVSGVTITIGSASYTCSTLQWSLSR